MKKDNGLTIYQKSVKKWGWLFLGPVMLAFAVGFLWPFLKGLYLSFCDFRLISEAKLSANLPAFWINIVNIDERLLL